MFRMPLGCPVASFGIFLSWDLPLKGSVLIFSNARIIDRYFFLICRFLQCIFAFISIAVGKVPSSLIFNMIKRVKSSYCFKISPQFFVKANLSIPLRSTIWVSMPGEIGLRILKKLQCFPLLVCIFYAFSYYNSIICHAVLLKKVS